MPLHLKLKKISSIIHLSKLQTNVFLLIKLIYLYLLRDSWGRKLSHVVAMDAICYSNPLDQYTIGCMSRELIKAYTCFRIPTSLQQFMFGVATGNWGCGAFNGDIYVKGMSYQ